MGTRVEKTLLVEGRDDKHSIVSLMSTFIAWGNKEAEWPVKIKPYDGVEALLDKHAISVELKSSEARILGVVVDANDDFDSRWGQLRNRCLDAFPALPLDMPSEGLVASNIEGCRFGAWIMPDNRSRGMLETFLMHLVPSEQHDSQEYARRVVGHAKRKGATFRDAQRDKAMIHTWLAWQNPPGRPFGVALASRILDPNSSVAGPFVSWFRRLFEL